MRRLPFPMAITTAFEMLQGKMSLKDYGSESRLFNSMLSLFRVATFFSGKKWLERLVCTFLLFNCLLQFVCHREFYVFDSKRVFQGCQDLGFPLLALYLQHGRTFESCEGDGCIASLLETVPPPRFQCEIRQCGCWCECWWHINGIYAMVMVVTKPWLFAVKRGLYYTLRGGL